MRNVIGSFILLASIGCSGEADALRRELSQKDGLLQELEQKLKDAEQQSRQEMEKRIWDAEMRHNQQLGECQSKLEESEREFEQTIQFTRTQLVDRENRITLLETQLKAPKPEVTRGVEKPPEPKSPVQIHIMSPPAADTFSATGNGAPKNELPVRVFDVRGEKIVTGTHISQELIETDETYRDDFGKKARVIDWQEKTVSQYGHQVVFSASNVTTSAKSITARAGRKAVTFTIEPGVVSTNLIVEATMGVGLRVSVGTREESYTVEYK